MSTHERDFVLFLDEDIDFRNQLAVGQFLFTKKGEKFLVTKVLQNTVFCSRENDKIPNKFTSNRFNDKRFFANEDIYKAWQVFKIDQEIECVLSDIDSTRKDIDKSKKYFDEIQKELHGLRSKKNLLIGV